MSSDELVSEPESQKVKMKNFVSFINSIPIDRIERGIEFLNDEKAKENVSLVRLKLLDQELKKF